MTARTVGDYLDLITSWQRGKPRFTATVEASVGPFVDAQSALAAIAAAFDLDTAVGAQLDVVGGIVGIGRALKRPTRHNWFGFNDAGRGFGQGVWRGPYDSREETFALGDADYRRLLRAKIVANHSTGEVRDAQAVMDAFFTGTGRTVVVVDRAQAMRPERTFAFGRAGRGFGEGAWEQRLFAFGTPGRGFGQARWKRPWEADGTRQALDMEMDVVVTGGAPSAIDLAVLAGQVLPIRPKAVSLGVTVTSVPNAPVFGFGMSNAHVAGFGVGAWGVSPQHLQAQAA